MNEDRTAMTVAEFCRKYAIHRSSYYRNAKLGRMPPAIKVGAATRILISDEQEWLDKQRNVGMVPEVAR